MSSKTRKILKRIGYSLIAVSLLAIAVVFTIWAFQVSVSIGTIVLSLCTLILGTVLEEIGSGI